MYDYTIPRGPVAAMFGSPGPVYGLPGLCGQQKHDPRSVHAKRPAWIFGIRHGKFSVDSSPGPVHHPDPMITRCGHDGTPIYSLYGRPTDLQSFKTPGPGAYSPQDAGPSAHPMPPRYSMRQRTQIRRSDCTPAANSYSLPKLMGGTVEGGKKASPIYSMTGRSKIGGFSEDLQNTPGPGTYGSTNPSLFLKRNPEYTMRPKAGMPGDSTSKPGPGAHSPEKVYVNKHLAPKFSFGIRHSQYTTPLISDVYD